MWQSVNGLSRSPRSKMKEVVRSILWHVGWFRRFVPNFGLIADTLTNLFSRAMKNQNVWAKECEIAFNSTEKVRFSLVLQSLDFSWRFLAQVGAPPPESTGSPPTL